MWVPQVLLAIIAACTAWIAFQQWVTARLKLNHDLFERRFAVYVATQECIVSCLNSVDGQIGDTRPFFEAQRVAPFLFGKEINAFLATVRLHAGIMETYAKYLDKPETPEWHRIVDDYNGAQQWLLTALQDSITHFYPSLNLSNAKPFAMRDILPIRGMDPIRAKVEGE